MCKIPQPGVKLGGDFFATLNIKRIRDRAYDTKIQVAATRLLKWFESNGYMQFAALQLREMPRLAALLVDKLIRDFASLVQVACY